MVVTIELSTIREQNFACGRQAAGVRPIEVPVSVDGKDRVDEMEEEERELEDESTKGSERRAEDLEEAEMGFGDGDGALGKNSKPLPRRTESAREVDIPDSTLYSRPGTGDSEVRTDRGEGRRRSFGMSALGRAERRREEENAFGRQL